MPEYKCIIVEDEPLAAKILSDYLQQTPSVKLEKTFRTAMDANEYLNTNEIDILFLDINLPKLKGFDFLKTLDRRPVVIVTTAYHEYALQAFDLNVADYLLKPIRFERFLSAVNKAISRLEKRGQSHASKDYLFVNEQHRKVKLSFDDILYIESQKEYVKIVTTKRTIVTKMSTTDIEKMLPPTQFKRVHRSYIVSVSKIDSYTIESVEIAGKPIPVGRGFRDSLNDI